MKENYSPKELALQILTQLRESVKKILSPPEKKELEKEPEKELTPEEKAQQAFFEVIVESQTPDGLQVRSQFSPPHSVFDITKLGDGAVFRINYVAEMNVMGVSSMSKAQIPQTCYVCCTLNTTTNKRELYIAPRSRPLKNGLQTESIYDKFIQQKSFSDLEVKQVSYQTPILDWDNPAGLFAKEIYQTEFLPIFEIEISLTNIEVVAGGKTETAKKSLTAETQQVAPERNIAPQPN